MMFAKKAINGKLFRFYYLIHWKKKTHAKDI